MSETIIVRKSFRHPDDDTRDGSRPRKNTSKSFVKEHVLNYVRALRRRFQFKLHFILNRGSYRARLTSYNVLFDWIQDKSVHFITLNPSSVQVRHDWRKNAVHILDHLVHFVQSFPSSASKNWTSKLYQYPYAYLDKFLSKRHLSFLVQLCSPHAWKLSQPHLHRKRLVGGHDWHHLDLGGLPNTNDSQSVSAHELSRHLSLSPHRRSNPTFGCLGKLGLLLHTTVQSTASTGWYLRSKEPLSWPSPLHSLLSLRRSCLFWRSPIHRINSTSEART